MNEKQYSETLDKLKHLCGRTEKCESDIARKLKEWNTDEVTKGRIIEELKKENFLNNERYVNSFINDKIKFNKWGKVKIKYHLKQKQINDGIIDELLTAFPGEEYKRICHTEIQKKFKTLRTKQKIAAKQKLIKFAQQRGFESALIFEVVNGILK